MRVSRGHDGISAGPVGAVGTERHALFREQQALDTPMLSGMRYSGTVAAFEDAA